MIAQWRREDVDDEQNAAPFVPPSQLILVSRIKWHQFRAIAFADHYHLIKEIKMNELIVHVSFRGRGILFGDSIPTSISLCLPIYIFAFV